MQWALLLFCHCGCCLPSRPFFVERKPAPSENYSLCTFFHLRITATHFLLCALFPRRRRHRYRRRLHRSIPYFCCNSNGADVQILHVQRSHVDCGLECAQIRTHIQPMHRRSADVKLPNNFNFHETSIIIKFCIIWSRNDEIEKEYRNVRHSYEVQAPLQTNKWKIGED